MTENILITGGTGLIGQRLAQKLREKGYQISLLSRYLPKKSEYPVFLWNPENGTIDPEAFTGISTIIHLAGAGIGDSRWSASRKEVIISSRTNTARLLHDQVKRRGIPLKTFLSSSATGYYGTVTTDRIFSEEDPPAVDFTGTTCRLWEEAADQFAETGARVIKIRTGIVLSREGGALPKMALPVKFGISPVFGNGKQWLPWIHIDDLCNLYVKSLEDETISGAFNGAAPESVTSREFMRKTAAALGKPFIPLTIPAFFLKIAFGEMASLLLEGSRISSEKIVNAGFIFRFPDLKTAFHDIYI
jgi:uncharacterized protein